METIHVDGFAHEFPDLANEAKGIAYSKTGARAYFVTLRPSMAARILEYNTDNYRKVRPKHVTFLTGQMRAKEFLMNGDPIRIRDDKLVADGQHRLISLANQDPGTEIEFLIVDDLPTETVPTINANAISRSYVDHLRHRGFQNATNRAALANLYHRWYYDRPLDASYTTSIHQLNALHDPISDRITSALANTFSLSRKIKGLPSTITSLAYLILSEGSSLSIKSLLIGVAEGENIHRGMPAYTLRRQLQSDWDNNVKRSRAELMWFIFRCHDIQYKNTIRSADDQLTIHRLLPLPPQGVSTRDLKKMLETE